MAAPTIPGYSVEDALDYAIEAIDHGNLSAGKKALEWVLQREPKNQVAWVWMACCVSDEDTKRQCFKEISEVVDVPVY